MLFGRDVTPGLMVTQIEDGNNVHNASAEIGAAYMEKPVYRPATTMHKTTMSALSGNPPLRRTLGLRRTMNGWDNRRNK